MGGGTPHSDYEKGADSWSPGSGGGRVRVWGPWVSPAASPSGLVVVPQPETVHMVPGGSQREGRLTFFTLDDSLARPFSFTSMMSLAWVCVEYPGWRKDRVALIFWPPTSRSLPMCMAYSLQEAAVLRETPGVRRGQGPREGEGDPRQGGRGTTERGMGTQRKGWKCSHVLHHAVCSGEHPLLVEQHASAVELTALEQGHLPGLGASGTWDSINNLLPTLVALVWTETWRNKWAASLRGRLSQLLRDLETDGDRQTDKELGRKGEQCRKSRRWRRRQRQPAQKPRRSISSWGATAKAEGRDAACGRQGLGGTETLGGRRKQEGRRQKAEESCLPKEEAAGARGGPEQAQPREEPLKRVNVAEDGRSGVSAAPTPTPGLVPTFLCSRSQGEGEQQDQQGCRHGDPSEPLRGCQAGRCLF